ncbi:hypothetical protein RC1_1617 [Rhodospirillum centenum SW]|uniref:Uncharacterized protein n=1 Tax=Rhodospirillum centenum (strain ATCC 51521 / SW) TaxID=414684 RepID=B6INC1_RHOCS|nr:hypothetical protein RC1_1617 [Rhodospirillum centenum SW]
MGAARRGPLPGGAWVMDDAGPKGAGGLRRRIVRVIQERGTATQRRESAMDRPSSSARPTRAAPGRQAVCARIG